MMIDLHDGPNKTTHLQLHVQNSEDPNSNLTRIQMSDRLAHHDEKARDIAKDGRRPKKYE